MRKMKNFLKKAYQAIDGKKGDEIVILDVSSIASFTDFFVICHGYNQKQNQAISDEIQERFKRELRLLPSHVEGYVEAEWILMDYLEFVVHIFSLRARRLYKLEKLWSDGVEVERKALSA